MVDPALDVEEVASGLTTPITLAFLADDDMLVTEKSTGRVQRVTGGTTVGTVLDLAVNFGPTTVCPGPGVPDDQFGGPEPDDAHLSGVILRLNGDGTTPADNPFFGAGATIGGRSGQRGPHLLLGAPQRVRVGLPPCHRRPVDAGER